MRKLNLIIALVVFIALPSLAERDVPHTFATGDTVEASTTNANNDYLEDQLDALDSNGNGNVEIQYDATDCTAVTGAVQGELCWEANADTIYACESATCDGSGWTASASSGDMLKIDYDSDNNSIVDEAETGDSATAFFSTGTVEDARIASTIARDSEVCDTKQCELNSGTTIDGTTSADVVAKKEWTAEGNGTALTWNVSPASCTGGTNGGKLTVNVSDEIVCDDDISDPNNTAAGVDISDVGDCDGSVNGECFKDGTNGTGSQLVLDDAAGDCTIDNNGGVIDFNCAVTGTSFQADDSPSGGNYVELFSNTSGNDPPAPGAGNIRLFSSADNAGSVMKIKGGGSDYVLLDGENVSGDLTFSSAGVGTIDASLTRDAETTSHFENIVLLDPADADDFVVGKAPFDMVVTDIDCVVDVAQTIEFTLQECNTAGASCSTDVESAITCSNAGDADDGTIDNATIDAGNWYRADFDNSSGSIGYIAITVTYTRDVVE